MKKIAFVLAVLLFATPAWAATISAVQVPDTNQVEIQYDFSDANLPRAFGLDITVTAGNIVACTPYMVGECNDVLRGYGIFPEAFYAAITVLPDGTVEDWGVAGYTPVASSGAGALGGIDTNGITIEMGSLYEDGNAPASVGVLCTIVVTENCTVEITGNAARCGENPTALGVVMENPDEVVIPEYVPGDVIIDCFPTAHPDYDEWVIVGKPDSWCNPRQCHGDADAIENEYGEPDPFTGEYAKAWVSTEDIAILISGLRKPYSNDPAVDPWIAADFDHTENEYGEPDPFTGEYAKARVSTEDIAILILYLRKDCPDDCF